MAASDDDLIDLAGAILDGTPVNWDAIETDPHGDPALLDELRVVSHVADVHRSQPIDGARREHPALAGIDPSTLPCWGPLLLLDRVGRGSFGDVFRAWDTRLEREVALKLIDASNPVSALEEGRRLARVRHPNVVTVHGAERLGSQVGIWTEFIRGLTLEQVLALEGPFTADAAAAIGVEICSALSAVHAAGLLHRDIKAQNAMREDGGRIVLMDFGAGLDAVAGDSGRSVVGTPLYVAPETLSGRAPTVESDIYSVGVLLYHLVTAAFPVSGDSLDDVAERHRAGEWRALVDARPDLPQNFIAVVDRATDRSPSRRFASAQALGDALASTIGITERPPRSRRAAWVTLGLAAAATAALLIIARATGLQIRPDGRGPIAPRATVAPASMTMRRVATPAMGLMLAGTPSFDGRLYSNTDLNEDMQVFDLASGAARRLTDKGTADEYAEFSALSPDGTQVVYSWLAADDTYDLRIADVNRHESRILVPRGPAVQIMPVEWSRDGSEVLCLLRQPANRFEIALVSIPSGRIRVVADLGSNRPQHVALSPDNRFVAYDSPSHLSAAQRDIFVQDVDGSPPRAIVSHPADDVSPEWTPDGRRLFFISNRSGTYDGWVVDVANGDVGGEPAIAVRNVGQVTIAGFTSTGALYYWRRGGDMDVFTRELAADAASRPERVLSRVEGANSAPAWSPDGRSLAYLSRRAVGSANPQPVIVIHPLGGGPDRELLVRLRNVGPAVIRWSPDGREILVGGQDGSGHAGTFVLQVDSGAIAPAVIAPLDRAPDEARGTHWWIDGRSFAYISRGCVVVRERGSDTERVIFDGRDQPQPLRLDNFEISPDGRSLAIAAFVDGDPLQMVLLATAIGGVPSELLRTTSPDLLALQTWTPDSRALLVTRRSARVPAARAPHALWRVALDGDSHDTGIRIPGFTHINRIQIDPSGTRIAFAADEVSWELWTMEHFLPEGAQ